MAEGGPHSTLGASQGMGDVELKIIVTHNLGDGVRSIAEWTKLPMGLVLPVLYLMLRWNCCKYVDHF
jgi:hypothetical protein